MKRKTPALVNTAILTLITIFMWIAFSVYRILASQPPINVPPEILEPISPALDRQVLAAVSERTFFEEGQVSNTFIYQGPQISQQLSAPSAPTLTITPSITPEATGSGQLTPTP